MRARTAFNLIDDKHRIDNCDILDSSSIGQLIMTKAISTQATAITRVWTLNASLNRALEAELGNIHGIGLTEYMVLMHLNKAPEQTMRRIDLADAVCRTASGVTRMLLPMEKIGLVQRKSNPRDARVSLVTMTRGGNQTFKDASVTMDAKSEYLLRQLSDKRVEQLLGLLDELSGE